MEENTVIEMGKRIYTLRTMLKLTQEEAAERANTTKQTLSLVEKGKNELRAGNIVRYADALGVSTDYLLKGLPSSSDLVLLDKRIATLNKDQYDFLSNIINKFIDLCEKTEQ